MDYYRKEKFYDTDVAKGVLISLIVAGHNTLINTYIPILNNIIYSFHVFGFLFLPFIRDSNILNRKGIWDRFVRYMVPFFVFYTLSAILFLLIEKRGQDISTWLFDYIIGLLINSAPLTDIATGFQLYWFLPTLLTLTILRNFLSQLSGRANVAAFVGFLMLHGFIGGTPEEFKAFVPFGIHIVIYIWPLAMMAGWLANRAVLSKKIACTALAILLFTFTAIIIMKTNVNLAVLKLFYYKNILLMLIHDTNAVAAFVTIVSFSAYIPLSKIWRALGKYSLEIYLFHSLIYQALLRAYQAAVAHNIIADTALLAGLILFVITCGISYAVAVVGCRLPVWRFAFPRSLDDWKTPRCRA